MYLTLVIVMTSIASHAYKDGWSWGRGRLLSHLISNSNCMGQGTEGVKFAPFGEKHHSTLESKLDNVEVPPRTSCKGKTKSLEVCMRSSLNDLVDSKLGSNCVFSFPVMHLRFS